MALGIKTEDIINKINEQPPTTEMVEPKQEPSVIKDLAMAPLRGVEGAVQSVYNLADWATFDKLPDYDNRFLGRSETVAGGLVEGVTQFLVPYAGIAKGVKVASGIGKVGKHFSRVNKKGKQVLNWKGVLASESAADFIAFDAQEERLANLMNEFPVLKNPISEYLAADENDGEIEGRLKNTLEGLGITGSVGGLVVGLRALRANRAGKDGAKVLRENASVFNSFSEVQEQFDAYSPAVKAAKNLVKSGADRRKGIPPNKVVDRLVRANNERGIGEELKWLGLDDPDRVRLLLPTNRDGNIDPEYLKNYIERNQLDVRLGERELTQSHYARDYVQSGGKTLRNRAFELKVNTDNPRMQMTARRMDTTNRITEKNQHNLTGKRGGESVIYHIRTTDRNLSDGTKVLFVEELQSDLIQGKKGSLKTGYTHDKTSSIDDPIPYGNPDFNPDQTGREFLERNRLPLEDSAMTSAIRTITQLATKEGYDKVMFAQADQVADLYKNKVGEGRRLKNKDGSIEYEYIDEDNDMFSYVKQDNGQYLVREIKIKDGKKVFLDDGTLVNDLIDELKGIEQNKFQDLFTEDASREAMQNTYTKTVNSFDELDPNDLELKKFNIREVGLGDWTEDLAKGELSDRFENIAIFPTKETAASLRTAYRDGGIEGALGATASKSVLPKLNEDEFFAINDIAESRVRRFRL